MKKTDTFKSLIQKEKETLSSWHGSPSYFGDLFLFFLNLGCTIRIVDGLLVFEHQNEAFDLTKAMEYFDKSKVS